MEVKNVLNRSRNQSTQENFMTNFGKIWQVPFFQLSGMKSLTTTLNQPIVFVEGR